MWCTTLSAAVLAAATSPSLVAATAPASRAGPAEGRRKAPTAPANPRTATDGKPCSRQEAPPIPGQPASAGPERAHSQPAGRLDPRHRAAAPTIAANRPERGACLAQLPGNDVGDEVGGARAQAAPARERERRKRCRREFGFEALELAAARTEHEREVLEGRVVTDQQHRADLVGDGA